MMSLRDECTCVFLKVHDPNVFIRSDWAHTETATAVLDNVQNVLSRCLAHVRVLDVHRTGRDRQDASRSKSYDLCLWIGPNETRRLFKSKKQLAKAVAPPDWDWIHRSRPQAQQAVAASSSGWTDQSRDWNYSSSGSGWDWRDTRAPQQSPSGDQAAHFRSVRSRVVESGDSSSSGHW